MKIYIPNINFKNTDKKALFILTRPFYSENGWTNDAKKDWNIEYNINYVDKVDKANIFLIPMHINWYFETKNTSLLFEFNTICNQNRIKAYGIIGGDFGIQFPDFSNIEYFRMGGFKKQLSSKNKGFPVSLSDYFKIIFNQENIIPTQKNELPIVGFCGHSDISTIKKFKEIAKCILENGKRFIKNPFNTVYEPLFASAYERAKLLQYLENNRKIQTNFIYRKNYRGGIQTPENREKTTLEYYNNIKNSDYVLCVRGAGNFSVRFYETLMMGKIPVFVDTDCLLPFETHINWKNHVVWIDWKDRKNIAEKILQFHNNICEVDFISLQLSNRKIWKELLSLDKMLNYLKL